MNKDIEHVWKQFHQELKSFVVSKVGNTNDADDILQNAFLKIIKNKEKVENAKDIRQYIYAIIRNTTIDFLRTRKNEHVEIDEFRSFSEEDSQSLNSTIADCCIKPFINKLPEKYKEALMITEFNNVSQKELAEQLQMSHSGVKSRVQRGREKLKQLILECCTLQSDAYGNLQGETTCKGKCKK